MFFKNVKTGHSFYIHDEKKQEKMRKDEDYEIVEAVEKPKKEKKNDEKLVKGKK